MLMNSAARIKAETGNTELANDAMSFASASHDYKRGERLAKLNEQWRKKYGKLLHGFLDARYSVGELADQNILPASR